MQCSKQYWSLYEQTLCVPKIIIFFEFLQLPLEHRISEWVLHPTWFGAVFFCIGPGITDHPSSWLMTRLHVFLGLPLLRLHWRFHSRACRVIRSLRCRKVWSIHVHFFFWRFYGEAQCLFGHKARYSRLVFFGHNSFDKICNAYCEQLKEPYRKRQPI